MTPVGVGLLLDSDACAALWGLPRTLQVGQNRGLGAPNPAQRCTLREVQAAQEGLEAGVGAQRVEDRLKFEKSRSGQSRY